MPSYSLNRSVDEQLYGNMRIEYSIHLVHEFAKVTMLRVLVECLRATVVCVDLDLMQHNRHLLHAKSVQSCAWCGQTKPVERHYTLRYRKKSRPQHPIQ